MISTKQRYERLAYKAEEMGLKLEASEPFIGMHRLTFYTHDLVMLAMVDGLREAEQWMAGYRAAAKVYGAGLKRTEVCEVTGRCPSRGERGRACGWWNENDGWCERPASKHPRRTV